jgi:predicted phage terminase large subunit-like protein
MAELAGRCWIVDIVRGRWEAGGVEAVVRQTATRDGYEVPVILKQEPGSSGKAVVAHYQRNVLKGFAVHAARDSGAKVLRAQPFAAAIEAGNVSLVQGPWNEAFLDEARAFPAGAHDDQVDAAADAWLRLSQQPVALIAI